MLTDAFTILALSLFKRTTTSWAQLHTADPGPAGLLGCSSDRRRVGVRWEEGEGTALVATNSLLWPEVQGIPGFPQTVTHLTIWSEPEDGQCWAIVPLAPVRVPHLATLEIPIGLTISLGTERTEL